MAEPVVAVDFVEDVPHSVAAVVVVAVAVDQVPNQAVHHHVVTKLVVELSNDVPTEHPVDHMDSADLMRHVHKP